MFDTYSILVVLALVTTFISFRYYNILVSLISTIFWLVLWKFNLTNPPAGMTVGSTEQQWLTYAYIAAAIVIMLIYFYRRSGNSKSFDMHLPRDNEPTGIRNKGLMELSADEYRQVTHRAINQRRRR
jgi:hypothetical protein